MTIGRVAVSFTIQVLSIEQAITDVVEQIDALLSTATNPKVVAALLNAPDELTGNHGGTPPTNGALDLLDADDPGRRDHEAVGVARLSHDRAGARRGRPLGARGSCSPSPRRGSRPPRIHEATVAIATEPRAGADVRLHRPSSSSPGRLVADGQYVEACERFRQATQKALTLMR